MKDNDKSNQDKITPRKKARQKRAQVTVSSIVTAATQLLQEKGIKKLTTNKIVERAGVSIGSLYQYFPSKESILSVVLEKQFNKDVDGFEKVLIQITKKDLPLKEAIDEIMKYVFIDYKVQSKFHKEIFFSILSLKSLQFTLKNDEKVNGYLDKYLIHYKYQIRDDLNVERFSFLFQYAMKGIKFGMAFADKEKYAPKLAQDFSTIIHDFIIKKPS
ncbi:MAG: AcrR family transcriptional regulator [Thermoproteota archaeon]|jgi:AcrR family transcriptional regulator